MHGRWRSGCGQYIISFLEAPLWSQGRKEKAVAEGVPSTEEKLSWKRKVCKYFKIPLGHSLKKRSWYNRTRSPEAWGESRAFGQRLDLRGKSDIIFYCTRRVGRNQGCRHWHIFSLGWKELRESVLWISFLPWMQDQLLRVREVKIKGEWEKFDILAKETQ